MKRIYHNYLKPQNYYNRLLTFFIIFSLYFAYMVEDFRIHSIELFFFKSVVFMFLLLTVAVFIEYFYRGDYMNPLEVYDIEAFVQCFLSDIILKDFDIHMYFNKFDSISKRNFEKVFNKKAKFFLSSIQKQGNVYVVTLINQKKMFVYYFLKFFVKGAIHKIYIRKFKGELKIIKFI